MEKKDRIRYSEVFKLKVMEELRDGKFKSVKEAAIGYGIAEKPHADGRPTRFVGDPRL